MAAHGDKIVRQMTDTPGRLSRAIPLFFAEQTHFYSDAKVWTLIPWIKAEEGGFVLGGVAWQNDDAASRARMDNVPSDYVVVSHLRTIQQPWKIELRLIRTIDAACLNSFWIPFPALEPANAIRTAIRNLIDQLKEHAEITPALPPSTYQVPTGPDFQYYLVRLEQLLALRCSGMEGVKGTFLSGERDILDGNLQLCLSQPKNSTVRILLFQTFRSMHRVRPHITAEYREKLERLQREHPVEEPIQSFLQRMLEQRSN